MSRSITDTAILIGFSPEGTCVYSEVIPLHEYWDGEHVWDSGEKIIELRLRKLKGFLFGPEGELLEEFESVFDIARGRYEQG